PVAMLHHVRSPLLLCQTPYLVSRHGALTVHRAPHLLFVSMLPRSDGQRPSTAFCVARKPAVAVTSDLYDTGRMLYRSAPPATRRPRQDVYASSVYDGARTCAVAPSACATAHGDFGTAQVGRGIDYQRPPTRSCGPPRAPNA